MTTLLKFLRPEFRERLPAEFFSADAMAPVQDEHLEPFPRPVDLQPLINVIEHAMKKFDGQPAKSDAWLACRIYHALRLSRREASDRRVWSYLAVVPLLPYVRWRWRKDDQASSKFTARFFGPMREQAIARLWWGAELTRNGASFKCTNQLFQNTDVPNSWLNLVALRHRPAAIAAVRFIYEHRIGEVPVGDRHRDLVKAFNSALTTTVLDAVAPTGSTDAAAIDEWISEVPDETLHWESDPPGPNEAAVDEAHVGAVVELITRIAGRTNFKRRTRSTKADSMVPA